MKFKQYTNQLSLMIIDKIGRRRRVGGTASRVSIKVSKGFAAMLRKVFKLKGRWEPEQDPNSERFMVEANIANVRFSDRFQAAIRVAVAKFKLREKRKVTYLDEKKQRKTINCHMVGLDCLFSCEQAPPIAGRKLFQTLSL